MLPKAPSPAPLISLFLHPLPWRLYPHTPLLQTHPSLVSLSKFPTPSSPSTYCHFLPKCGRPMDSTFNPKAVAQNVPCSSRSASLLPGLPQSSWRGRLALSFLHSLHKDSPWVAIPAVRSSRDEGLRKSSACQQGKRPQRFRDDFLEEADMILTSKNSSLLQC